MFTVILRMKYSLAKQTQRERTGVARRPLLTATGTVCSGIARLDATTPLRPLGRLVLLLAALGQPGAWAQGRWACHASATLAATGRAWPGLPV